MQHLLAELHYPLVLQATKISNEKLKYDYGKLLQKYIENLNKLIAGTPYEEKTLEQILLEAEGPMFNNAAQTWNHTFFFDTLTPQQPEMPQPLADALARDFGSVETFKEKFTQAATTLFGSGWTWLVSDKDGHLSIVSESNAGNPLKKGLKPLLVIDVWEHAYYIDYRNRRAAFIEAFWTLVDWQKVAARL